jgi:hypothetical protein
MARRRFKGVGMGSFFWGAYEQFVNRSHLLAKKPWMMPGPAPPWGGFEGHRGRHDKVIVPRATDQTSAGQQMGRATLAVGVSWRDLTSAGSRGRRTRRWGPPRRLSEQSPCAVGGPGNASTSIAFPCVLLSEWNPPHAVSGKALPDGDLPRCTAVGQLAPLMV